MAVGTTATAAQMNAQLASVAMALRSTAQQILSLSVYANDLGLAGLEAVGFGSDDAQTFLNMVDYMATVAQVYQGTATQGSEFNFSDALTAVTGPY
jgi:hypothetical protein